MKFLTTLLLTILTFSLTSAQTVFNYSDSLHSYKISVDSIFLGYKLSYDCYIKTISVYSKSSKNLLQIITPPDNTFLPQNPIFDLDDINFDGLTDFMIVQGFSAGPNVSYYYWTFNNKINQFQRDTTLEVITSPSFDKQQKLVTSFWRASCCDYGLSTYKYIDGKITLIEETETVYLDNPEQQIRTKKKLVDGEMKLVERTVEKVEKEK